MGAAPEELQALTTGLNHHFHAGLPPFFLPSFLSPSFPPSFMKTLFTQQLEVILTKYNPLHACSPLP